MVDCSGKPRLAQKALTEARILGQLGRDQLQRDRPIETGVERPVDDAHPAAADLTLDPIVGKGRHLRGLCPLERGKQSGNLVGERFHPSRRLVVRADSSSVAAFSASWPRPRASSILA